MSARIQGVRLNLSDMERVVTHGDHMQLNSDNTWAPNPAWSVEALFGPVLTAALPNLRNIHIFDMIYINNISTDPPCFPTLRSTSDMLVVSMHSVTCVELSSIVKFFDLRDLQYFLCSLPSLRDLTFNRISVHEQRDTLVDPPKNLALRTLNLHTDDHSHSMYCGTSYSSFFRWLADTDTAKSIQHLSVTERIQTPWFGVFLRSITGCLSWDIHDYSPSTWLLIWKKRRSEYISQG
jgi:hypothetical protein